MGAWGLVLRPPPSFLLWEWERAGVPLSMSPPPHFPTGLWATALCFHLPWQSLRMSLPIRIGRLSQPHCSPCVQARVYGCVSVDGIDLGKTGVCKGSRWAGGHPQDCARSPLPPLCPWSQACPEQAHKSGRCLPQPLNHCPWDTALSGGSSPIRPRPTIWGAGWGG